MPFAIWQTWRERIARRRKIATAGGLQRAAPYEDYCCFKFRKDRGVLFVTIDHPPMNLLDQSLLTELGSLATDAAADDEVKVIVFESADPEYFVSHAAVNDIQNMPTKPPRRILDQRPYPIYEQYWTLPKVTIAKIEGAARGGGSEFALSLDMRFGAIGKAVLAQSELTLGLATGGGASQKLPRLMGRARALEVLLSCDDFSAEMAERYGYINRALPADEIGPRVEEIAYAIGSYPLEAIALVKQTVQAAELPLAEGLAAEARIFNQTVNSDVARKRMARYFELGGQTREGDRDMRFMIDEFAKVAP